MVPQSENKWLLTSDPGIIAQYGYDIYHYNSEGVYKEAQYTDYAGDDECHAEIQGNTFVPRPLAVYEDGRIAITFNFDTPPQEYVTGACASAGFEWQLSDLLYGWSAALSGSPQDTSGILTQADAGQLGAYSHTFTADTNPSPENRDHVQVTIDIICMKYDPNNSDAQATAYIQTACPWQQEH